MAQLLKKFPVQAGLAALLVFLLTFSHGLTLPSVGASAKIAGWDWMPLTNQPLLWLITLPFRLLPASWVPPALNLFTAISGALVIGKAAAGVTLGGLAQTYDGTPKAVGVATEPPGLAED